MIKFIDTYAELRAIPNSTTVHHFHRGKIQSYLVVGVLKSSSGLILSYEDKLSELKMFYEREFRKGEWTLDFTPREAGLVMIKQIEEASAEDIKFIKEVYLR